MGGKIAVRVEREGDTVSIEVADNGNGIPEQDMKFLFNEFYRGK